MALTLRPHAVALAAVLLGTFGMHLLAPVANATTVALGFVLIVVFTATTMGSGPAISASVAATVCFNFFFLPPVGTLTISDPLNWVALVAFLAVAISVGNLSGRARLRAAQAEASQKESERLYRELQHAFERDAAAEAMRRSDRLKTALLDAVTHDFRTPLTSIKASTSTLAETWPRLDDSSRRELLEVIDEETDRLDDLVEDLVELARIESGEFRLTLTWCNLEDIVSAALRRVQRRLRGHVISVDLPADLPIVRADTRAMTEMVYQLLDNAVKYSPAHSVIRVSAVETPGEMVELRVDDEGPGITVPDRERVFEKFHRVGAATGGPEGLGMGLTIVRRLVESHGGSVEAGDVPHGRGARLSLRVPIGDDPAEPAREGLGT